MIKNINELWVGCKVHYQPEHYAQIGRFENGIVKVIRPKEPNAVWVVYNCNGEWGRFWDFTSAKTRLEDLRMGWITVDNEEVILD